MTTAVAGLLLAGAPSAHADPQSAMAAELAAAGLPGLSVSVDTPPAASASELAAFDIDFDAEFPSLLPENLIAPDPTAPLPVATVQFGAPTVAPLPGVLTPPGVTDVWASLQDAKLPVWRLQIMLALKHQLAAGESLSGVAMWPVSPNLPDTSSPDLHMTPPDAADYPPAPLSQSMPVEQVEFAIRTGLPAWAQSAEVEVTTRYGGQRQVEITLQMIPATAAVHNPQDLAAYAIDRQLALAEQGAAIESVIVKTTDSLTGNPLTTYAGDGTWGQNFLWVSPLVRAWVDRAIPGAPPNPVGEVDALDPERDIEDARAAVEDGDLLGEPSP